MLTRLVIYVLSSDQIRPDWGPYPVPPPRNPLKDELLYLPGSVIGVPGGFRLSDDKMCGQVSDVCIFPFTSP